MSERDSSEGERPAMQTRVLSVPKSGAEEKEYEDAACVQTAAWPVRAAVADGATESAFARSWAERLARGVVEQGATPEAFGNAVSDWQTEWRAAVRTRAQGRPWYVAAKAEEGAFATLLGLSLTADGQWRAVSVGDCCLFQVRDGALVRSWPFGTAEAFTNRPALVPSRPDQALPAPEHASESWTAGDGFVLATDAVAAWLLNPESRVGPATAGAWDDEQFRRAVDRGRAEERLRNDDATLLVIRIAEAEAPTPPSMNHS